MANRVSRTHRKERIRKKVTGSTARPRLTIYKSLKHMHAQVIDDGTSRTLASASTLSKELKGKLDRSEERRVGKECCR